MVVAGRKRRRAVRPGEKADTSKALISYQPQEEDFSSPFLHLLQREGHHNLQRSANPQLPANGARPLLALPSTPYTPCLLTDAFVAGRVLNHLFWSILSLFFRLRIPTALNSSLASVPDIGRAACIWGELILWPCPLKRAWQPLLPCSSQWRRPRGSTALPFGCLLSRVTLHW